MKKVFLFGNHSSCHCGSKAVWKALEHEIKSQDIEIVSTIEESDILILNGEGSMHHNSKTCQKKMSLIEKAQKLEKETYLLNSVWMENTEKYNNILYNIDGIICREIASCRDLMLNHNVSSIVAPDLSFFNLDKNTYEEILDAKKTKFEIGITDFYCKEFNAWTKITGGNILVSYKYIDMNAHDWRDFVEYISKFKLVITGRFHAICACILARTPFISLKSNSHKIEGLIQTTRSDIPHAVNPEEINNFIESILDSEYSSGFEKVFDWPCKFCIKDAIPERIFR